MGAATSSVTTGVGIMQGSLLSLLAPIAAIAGAFAIISDILSFKATIAGDIGHWLDNLLRMGPGSGWGYGGAGAGTVVPTYASGGIVSGAIGAPQLAVVHGGEPIGAAGFAQVIDYGKFGEAVSAGVYDALSDLRGSQQPVILTLDGKTLGRVALPLIQAEKVRLGLETV